MNAMKVITQLLLDHISFNRTRRDRSSNMHFNVDTHLNMTEDLTMDYPAMHLSVMAHLTWWTGKLYPFHQAHNLCFRHTEMQNLKQRRIIIREIIELDESYRLMQRSLLVHVVSWIWKLLRRCPTGLIDTSFGRSEWALSNSVYIYVGTYW